MTKGTSIRAIRLYVRIIMPERVFFLYTKALAMLAYNNLARYIVRFSLMLQFVWQLHSILIQYRLSVVGSSLLGKKGRVQNFKDEGTISCITLNSSR